jgi:hypothetical protein
MAKDCRTAKRAGLARLCGVVAAQPVQPAEAIGAVRTAVVAGLLVVAGPLVVAGLLTEALRTTASLRKNGRPAVGPSAGSGDPHPTECDAARGASPVAKHAAGRLRRIRKPKFKIRNHLVPRVVRLSNSARHARIYGSTRAAVFRVPVPVIPCPREAPSIQESYGERRRHTHGGGCHEGPGQHAIRREA